ncbi:MAG TPA: hypothetical protein VMK32_03275 [Burkholderiaceae bacterium]|nr:hypothetical protein [Burkholderiaceae bacterium]
MEGRPVLLVALLAIAIAGGGLYFVLQPGTPVVETKDPPLPPPQATPAPASNAPAAVPPAGADPKSGSAIYRCQKGRSVVYSDTPCEGGKLVDIQPTRGYETSRTAAAHPSRVVSTEPAPPAPDATPSETTRPAECKRLDDLIAWIDAEARQGGATPRMDELKERRRKAADRRYELHC